MPTQSDGRPLTLGEIGMLREVYGNRIPVTRVRIYAHRWMWPFPTDRAMAPNGSMYMPDRNYAADYSAPGVNLYHKGVFIHECAHLYQWYVLSWNVWARGPFDRTYTYELVPGRKFVDYGLEQMGMIAEHYYVLKHGGRPGDLPDSSYTVENYASILPVE